MTNLANLQFIMKSSMSRKIGKETDGMDEVSLLIKSILEKSPIFFLMPTLNIQ